MANKELSLKSLVAFERWSGKNVFDLINKENKSATDLYQLAGISLYNSGKIKKFDDLDALESDVLDAAIKELNEATPPTA